jgi:hypothetical protein
VFWNSKVRAVPMIWPVFGLMFGRSLASDAF